MSRIALAALILAAATPAFAQTVATAPPAAPQDNGPAIPGLCFFSQQAAVANAKVGVAASQRLKQFVSDADAQNKAEEAPLEAEGKALQATQSTTTNQSEWLQKAQQFQAKRDTVQQHAAQRNRQIEATRERQLQVILSQAQPLLNQVYKDHRCGVLLDRSIVFGGNVTDLTADLVKAMDATLTAQNFDLVPITSGAASAPAAAAPAAAPAASTGKKKK